MTIVKQHALDEPSRLRWETEPIDIDLRPARERMVVVPRGELDVATVGQLAAEIDDLAGRGFDAIALDLREISFMDSSGVHLLLEHTARADAPVTVIGGSEAVRRVIDLCGVRHLLPVDAGP
jgi:anti-sigma B factor antagonist